MANIRVNCPTCKSELEIDEQHAGQEVECGSCMQVFVARREEQVELPVATLEEPPASGSDRGSSRRDDDDVDRDRGRSGRRRQRDDADDYDYPPRRQPKSRLAYILLGVLLGEFGAHNFYAGHT